MPVPIDFAKLSLLGNRQENQDRIELISHPESTLMICVDGMGGHSNGARAAEIVVDTLGESFTGIARPVFDPQGFLAMSLAYAHDRVVDIGMQQHVDHRPRATCAICLVQDGSAYWAHVGDSRIYQIRNGKIVQRTRDAMSALRGYALSGLESCVVFSAGMNPHLYSYAAQFDDFFPDESGRIRKQIVLKVSDYRSAAIQGRFLAKRGLWISEYRIESGLNCGGHAFPTKGLLMGPILEEFRRNRASLVEELHATYAKALAAIGRPVPEPPIGARVTVQGGIGTAEENALLLDHFEADATGWGTPFLLVPEATRVDPALLEKLSAATADDVYDANAGGANTLLQLRAYGEIAYEIYDELRDAPAAVAVPVSNGTTLAGIYRGFLSLFRRGKCSRMPRFVAGSSFRKNPIVTAFTRGTQNCEDLPAGGIRETFVNEPLVNWRSIDGDAALEAIRSTGGSAKHVSDKQMLSLSRLLREREGLSILPASTAGLQALIAHHGSEGLPADRYVAVLTGRKQ